MARKKKSKLYCEGCISHKCGRCEILGEITPAAIEICKKAEYRWYPKRKYAGGKMTEHRPCE